MSESGGVLVLAPNWLGDAVMALPAVADLRRHFSAHRLVVAARASVSSLFTLVPGIDSIVSAEVSSIRGSGASIAVLFPNSFASAWLVKRSGVAGRWGYSADRRGLILTRAIPRPRVPMHQSEYYQHLVRALGIENAPRETALAIPPDSLRDARTLLTERGWKPESALVVLAPGAAYG